MTFSRTIIFWCMTSKHRQQMKKKNIYCVKLKSSGTAKRVKTPMRCHMHCVRMTVTKKMDSRCWGVTITSAAQVTTVLLCSSQNSW